MHFAAPRAAGACAPYPAFFAKMPAGRPAGSSGRAYVAPALYAP